jgi:hypothetical protein
MNTHDLGHAIEKNAQSSASRLDFWSALIAELELDTIAEIGVWRGEFAEHVLLACPSVKSYYLVDPWRHLSKWDKPFNVSNEAFDKIYVEAISRLSFAKEKLKVLRCLTADAATVLPNQGLDLCYVDADHSLRGVTIDLIRLYPKVRNGGVLCGDDFTTLTWQHGNEFEPTLVFPFVVYFAEATGSNVYALPHNQFAIVVDRSKDDFRLVDLTGRYSDHSMRSVLATVGMPDRSKRAMRLPGRIKRGLFRIVRRSEVSDVETRQSLNT